MDFLERAASGDRISEPVALVLAHPDDETASAGGLLQRLLHPKLIYLTDGAPRDLVDAKRRGFAGWQGYAELRKRELAAALRALGINGKTLFYDRPDKEALDALPQLVERLMADLSGMHAVVTHAYELGHPDHDTAAAAVALACERLGQAAPRRAEFASYHLEEAGAVFGRFEGESEVVVLELSPEELERKRAALAAYASQQEILSEFPISPERFRAAPHYDFRRSSAPARALYDLWGWDITSERWRSRLAELLG